MSDTPEGHIITFYSYKGGTGRTMALANTAWILASNGKRVLALDWDLESPGLHKYFHPFLDANIMSSTGGVVDMITEYVIATSRDPRPGDWHVDYAKVQQNAVSVDWSDFPGEGTVDVVFAGRQSRDYTSLVASMDWEDFYTRRRGGQYLDALKADMKRHYDYILIDSRTGLSDIADICTIHFPDTLVTCFSLNDQSIEGASAVARHIDGRYGSRHIRILPVPMRVEDGEKVKLDAGRELARRRFDGFPVGMSPAETREYWGAIEIPYKPFYAFEETLAAFGDAPGSPTSLLAAFERLVGVITWGEVTSMPPFDENRRLRIREQYARKSATTSPRVLLSYVPEDRMWADWIAALLRRSGFQIQRQDEASPTAGPGAGPDMIVATIALLSISYMRSPQAQALWGTFEATEIRSQLVPVRVADVRPPAVLGDRVTLDLMFMEEEQATETLLRKLGRPHHPNHDLGYPPGGPRFPGTRPTVWNVPNRNAAFTGRNDVLDKLRDRIISGGKAVVRPQALHGLGGVGKTQVALEYAHRFMADYDVVWWIAAEHLDRINPTMAELAGSLGTGVNDSVSESSRAAHEALRRGDPFSRWLLIFDNADDPHDLERFLPSGSGHILITSRNPAWSRVADPLEVDVFNREESVEHLLRRAPGVDPADADRVASTLGDLPLAIENASAWLEQTGMPAGQYVEHLRTQVTETLSLGELSPGYPTAVAATWNLSIERLKEHSPASVRMLELLSFFASEPISLDLVYCDAMVGLLKPYDSAVNEKVLLGPVIRHLGRYALAKVDQVDRSVQVHRLIQGVVRDRMDPERRDETAHDVHRILVAAAPELGATDDPGNWPRYDEIWPHLGPSMADQCGKEDTRSLLIDRVRYLWKRGDFEASLSFGDRLVRGWNIKLGEDDRQTTHLRFHIANTLRSMGRYEEAFQVDTEVLSAQTRTLGEFHPFTLMTAGGLAADLRALGDFDQALRVDNLTYVRVRESFGEDHPRTLMSAHNLGVSLRLAGEFSKARKLDLETVDRRRQMIGEMHPYTLYSIGDLAHDLRELGHFAESVEMLRVNLEHHRRVLGDDMIDTLRTATSLATSLRRSGAMAEARVLIEETYERYVARYGTGAPDSLSCRLELTSCLAAAGETIRALELATDAMSRFQESLGRDHPLALATANNVAIYLRLLGRLDEAKELTKATLDALIAGVGEAHPLTLVCAINMANCLAWSGLPEAAESLERTTLTRLTRMLGPGHSDTLICEGNLAVSLNALGEAEEARELRERVVRAMRHTLGDDHPHVIALAEWHRNDRDLEPQPW
ncbi:FxSxx-COOH system tetratricopeptide repeat protein [Sphaerisporangium corydalis]|uniref:FxSxx-COOH system tetratricopeptide repeat protein n=1 Tax=Sphaerisporangium corydalis TaxID=1441875 RepID=A0ABV9EBV2_9ACTN|nr:FxSxx-COOH system tetratricopeptide repeat protein [Sphaerisporangium corydalis]